MTFGTLLRLGRVSNLPTVWTNALAGAVLATGAYPSLSIVLLAALVLTLFYEGGMWLNDAFDAEIDAQERANRPIPMGEISRNTVYLGGVGLLGAGLIFALPLGAGATLAAILLAISVVLYDWLHKRTALSPLIMGATRLFSYLVAGLAMSHLSGSLVLGALGLFAYIIGLTYAAKQEAYDRIGAAWPLAALAIPLLYALWATSWDPLALLIWLALVGVVLFALSRLFRRQPGDVPTAVVTMIAGISLYDATLIAGLGHSLLALLCVAAFGLTLYLQRVASGT